MFFKLQQAIAKELTAPPPTTPRPAHVITHYDYEPPSLAKCYRDKLARTPRQISWLNRISLPSNTFPNIEAGRETTVRLCLGVLPLLAMRGANP